MASLAQGGTGLVTSPYAPGRGNAKPCLWCALPCSERDSVIAAELGAIHEKCLGKARSLTRGELLAHVLWGKALRGEEWAAKQLLARLWPEKHLVDLGLQDNDDQGARQSHAAAFDALPIERRELVHSTLSAVLQGKPELAGVG